LLSHNKSDSLKKYYNPGDLIKVIVEKVNFQDHRRSNEDQDKNKKDKEKSQNLFEVKVILAENFSWTKENSKHRFDHAYRLLTLDS
jgi:hypothetical protein